MDDVEALEIARGALAECEDGIANLQHLRSYYSYIVTMLEARVAGGSVRDGEVGRG
jgi:hypothetical protein